MGRGRGGQTELCLECCQHGSVGEKISDVIPEQTAAAQGQVKGSAGPRPLNPREAPFDVGCFSGCL